MLQYIVLAWYHGQIAFDPLGNPTYKPVLILGVSAGGFLQIVSQTGKFLVGP